MARYYQKFNKKTGKWIKINIDTGMVVDMDSEDFANIPKTTKRKNSGRGLWN